MARAPQGPHTVESLILVVMRGWYGSGFTNKPGAHAMAIVCPSGVGARHLSGSEHLTPPAAFAAVKVLDRRAVHWKQGRRLRAEGSGSRIREIVRIAVTGRSS
jgi:hypothetical protein